MDILVNLVKLFVIYSLFPIFTVKFIFKFTPLKKFVQTDVEKVIGTVIIISMILVIYFVEKNIGTL
ncbi:hypothetical protein BKG89_05205 [Rodentibacter caecimuris]|uniref:Uncharacterized protein n=1 Tax=Rodentibacter caecimuris TaxID=1796644 RepID=A0ABX3KX86_9PAST|nr:hypothetical protein BKG89_05205 [Rodentibacter heylii]